MCERCEHGGAIPVGKSIVLVRSIESGADELYFIESGDEMPALGAELESRGEYALIEGIELESAY